MSSCTRELARVALNESIRAREDAGLDLKSPVCIYDLCQRLGVTVRFHDINMEGMYAKGPSPRIHLSSLRPMPRRAFNCAHELGHHRFGHGSTIDELQNEARQHREFSPDEFLADAFASYLLMPTLGLRSAFSVRGWQPESATPSQIYVAACNFGVGYRTLVTHLANGLRHITQQRMKSLLRKTPQDLRTAFLGKPASEALIVCDRYSTASSVEAEIGDWLLMPSGSVAATDFLDSHEYSGKGRLFRASRRGVATILCPTTFRRIDVRIAPRQFVGLSHFRHLEDEDDD
jgi:Zn-dependent peptidase ImmA (M78 family)